MKRRVTITLRAAVIAVIALCLWFFIRNVEWDKLWTALRGARLWPLLVAAVLNFGCLLGKAGCWRVMLAPRYHVKLARLFRYTVAAFAGSVLAPARAGEVLRLWTLKRRDGVPVADSAAVAVAEKLVDGVSMLVLVAPVPWLLPGLAPWVEHAILLCGGIAVGVFIGLYIAVALVEDAPGGSWFRRFITGMHVLRAGRRLGASLAIMFAVWILDLAEVGLVLYAVGIDLPITAMILILFTLNLTIMVPSTPAQIGALELGALAATRLLHVPDEPALAFALLYHAAQVIPLVIVGLALELRLVLGREKIALVDEPAA